MKKYILIFLFIVPFWGYTQVTIKNIEKIKDTAVLRPTPYDSLNDFKLITGGNTSITEPDSFYQYKKYIGQKFYLPPISNARLGYLSDNGINVLYSTHLVTIDTSIDVNCQDYKYSFSKIITYTYKPFVYWMRNNYNWGLDFKISSDSSFVCNNYYTLLDVLYEDTLKNLIYQMRENLNCEDKNKGIASDYQNFIRNVKIDMGSPVPEVLFLIRSDSTKDSLYCTDLSRFILVPYFSKQKQLYQNKTLICTAKPSSYSWYDYAFGVDVYTNKEIKLYYKSKWKCTDVTFLKVKVEDFYAFSFYKYNIRSGYLLYRILKNDNGETIAEPIGDETSLSFITEDEFNKIELEKNLSEAQLIAKQKQEKQNQIDNEKLNEINRRNNFITKYGQYFGGLISDGKVVMGMSPDMCKDSWGAPYEIFKNTTSEGTKEYWYYGWKYSLIFIDEKLVEINE